MKVLASVEEKYLTNRQHKLMVYTLIDMLKRKRGPQANVFTTKF